MKLKRHSSYLLSPLTAILALLVYWLTLAPDLTWAHFGGDGGELITAAVTLGIPHPPGYPTYVILGNLISKLPFGSIAFRFNLWTAVCMATAAGFVTAIAIKFPQKSNKKGAGALAAGLTLSFLPLVWHQALITEVYGLNALFVTVCLWALLTDRPAWLVGLWWGLAITTHLTAVFLLLPILSLTPPQQWKFLVSGLLLGLLPFFILPFLALGNSPVLWGNPTTLQNWWWLVSGTLYHPNLFSYPVANWGHRARGWFTLLILPLIVLAIMNLWAVKVTQDKHKRKILILFLTAMITFIYAFTYQTDDAIVFALPALLLLTIAAIPTFKKLNRAALILPLICLLLNFNSHNLRSEKMVRPWLEAVLDEAPSRAILLTDGAPDIFGFWYFHIVEKQRPDMIVVDGTLFQFDWYRNRLKQLHTDLHVPPNDNVDEFQATNKEKRPFCFVKKIDTRQENGPSLSCLAQ